MITFELSDWFEVKDKMSWLYELHWEEVATDKDKMRVNLWNEQYDFMANDGQLQIITAHADNKIVGYHWSITRPHLHYADTLVNYQDVYFLHPDYRKGMNGVKLFQFAEAVSKDRGVKKLYGSHKIKLDVGAVFDYLGWTHVENNYTKYIG